MSARLLDPKDKRGRFPFEYTPAAGTDVAETFRRIRKEQEAAKATVTPISGAKKVRKS